MSNCRIEAKRNRSMKPTKAQKEAFKKLMQRGGRELLTKEDMIALSTYKALTVSQRNEFAALAAAA